MKPEEILNSIKNTKLKDNEGVPILYYHGSDYPITEITDEPMYFSSRKDYRAVAERPFQVASFIKSKSPYIVDNISVIESLKAFPEKIEALRKLGFDAVVYAHESDLTRGASGWGDDKPQVVVLDSSIIELVQDKDFINDYSQGLYDKEFYNKSKNHPSVIVYHHTPNFFTQFEHSSDIGFHFGTLKSTKERALKTGHNDITIEKNTLTQVGRDRLLVSKGEYPTDTLADKVYALMITRLENPSKSLRRTMDILSDEELDEIYNNCKGNPESKNYLDTVKNAPFMKEYSLMSNGVEITSSDSIEEIAFAKGIIERNGLVKARLNINNPLRLSDLGQWNPYLVATEAGLSREEVKSIMSHERIFDQRDTLIEILKSKGYDSIVYKNEVEDKGKDSYIVFDDEPILRLQHNITRTISKTYINEMSL